MSNTFIVHGRMTSVSAPKSEFNVNTIQSIIYTMQAESNGDGKLGPTFILNPEHRMDKLEQTAVEQHLHIRIIYDREVPMRTIWCPDREL